MLIGSTVFEIVVEKPVGKRVLKKKVFRYVARKHTAVN